jgi:hypothetical protein
MRVNVLTGETLFRRAYIRSMVDQMEVTMRKSESSATGRFRMSGTRRVATRKASMIARNASAKASVEASR